MFASPIHTRITRRSPSAAPDVPPRRHPLASAPVRDPVRLRVQLAGVDVAALEATRRRGVAARRSLALEQVGGVEVAVRARADQVGACLSTLPRWRMF